MSTIRNGFFSFWRQSRESEVFNGHLEELGLLHRLTEMAAYAPKTVHRGNRIISLSPGQLLTNRRELMLMTGKSERSTRTLIARLEKWSKIAQENDRTGMLITILDYCDIRDSKNKNDRENDRNLTETCPSHFEFDRENDRDFKEVTYCYDEVITDSEFENDRENDRALKREKEKKGEKPNPLSGGNSLACARPGDNGHHLGGEVKSAKDALRKAEEEIRFLKLRGSLGDDKLVAKVTQFCKDRFDFAFRNDKTFAKRGHAGFEFLELNLAVSDLIDEKGIEWAGKFGDWLCEYKRANAGFPLKLDRMEQYRRNFEKGTSLEDLTAMSRRYAELRGN